MSGADVQWQLEGHAATLACGPLAGRVEPAAIGDWFRLTHWQGQTAPVYTVLAARGEPCDAQAVQRHIRGRDFISTYPRTQSQGMTQESCWRAMHHVAAGAVQLEIVCSKHTNRLDSIPQSSFVTQATGTQVLHCAALTDGKFEDVTSTANRELVLDSSSSRESLFLWRRESRGPSYAEMVHPSDFVRTRVWASAADLWSAESVIFPERLEKGVIRKARICGWFLAAENDLATAIMLARQFVAEPLPLTT